MSEPLSHVGNFWTTLLNMPELIKFQQYYRTKQPLCFTKIHIKALKKPTKIENLSFPSQTIEKYFVSITTQPINLLQQQQNTHQWRQAKKQISFLCQHALWHLSVRVSFRFFLYLKDTKKFKFTILCNNKSIRMTCQRTSFVYCIGDMNKHKQITHKKLFKVRKHTHTNTHSCHDTGVFFSLLFFILWKKKTKKGIIAFSVCSIPVDISFR